MTTSQEPFRLIFVCMGNICRSPAGENVMNTIISKAGLEHSIDCDSAGTIDYHTGKSPDARMCASARNRGYDFVGSARQVEYADLKDHDLIIAMDRANHGDLCALDQNKRHRKKIAMFTSFCTEEAVPEDVPDPYYGGPEGFERVLDLLEDGCQGLLAEIKKRID